MTPKDRCKTGITGLDEVLTGGLPSHQSYMIKGRPGSGKTTLSIQFLLAGIDAGEQVLYISLSENKHEIQQVADSHGWQIEKMHILDQTAIVNLVQTESQNTVFHPAEYQMQELIRLIKETIENTKPRRVAFDSVSEIRFFSQSELRFRSQIMDLKQYLRHKEITALFVEDGQGSDWDFVIDTLMHGVISLDMTPMPYGAIRRSLMIQKLRGVNYWDGPHDFAIRPGGIELFPRVVCFQPKPNFKRETVSSGIDGVDTLFGGGLDTGTTNLFIGSAGTGKSFLSAQYAYHAAKNGRKGLIYLFEETVQNYVEKSKNIGIDLAPLMKKGLIYIEHVEPAELTPGELSEQVRKMVMKQDVSVFLMDSINGYLHAMPDDRFLLVHLHELFTFLNRSGVLSVFIAAQSGLIENQMDPAHVSYLADTVIAFRFFEFKGQIKKAVSVFKKRTSGHEHTIREFNITSDGIRVGKPLTDFQGVLTGVPVYTGNQQEIFSKSS